MHVTIISTGNSVLDILLGGVIPVLIVIGLIYFFFRSSFGQRVKQALLNESKFIPLVPLVGWAILVIVLGKLFAYGIRRSLFAALGSTLILSCVLYLLNRFGIKRGLVTIKPLKLILFVVIFLVISVLLGGADDDMIPVLFGVIILAIIIYSFQEILMTKGIWLKLTNFILTKLPQINTRKNKGQKSTAAKKTISTNSVLPNIVHSFSTHKKIMIFAGLAMTILLLAAGAIRLYEKIDPFNQTAKTCSALSPLALKNFKQAAGVAPLLGEKCILAKNSYLIKLLYKTSDDAQTARTGIVGSTQGKQQNIGAFDWVVWEKNSSVFLVDEEKLGILIILGTNSTRQVKDRVARTIKNDWNWQTENLTLTDLDQDQEKYQMGCQKPLVKDLSFSAHTVSNYPCSYSNTYEGDYKLHLRCNNSDGASAQYFYQPVDVSQTTKLTVNAEIGIQDHSESTIACSQGIYATGFTALLIMSDDPKSVLADKCPESVSEDDWPNCIITKDDPSVLGICELDFCRGLMQCKLEKSTFGLGSDKLYVVFKGIDKWTDVDIRNWMDNLEICRE